jgi:hypothetical protein
MKDANHQAAGGCVNRPEVRIRCYDWHHRFEHFTKAFRPADFIHDQIASFTNLHLV